MRVLVYHSDSEDTDSLPLVRTLKQCGFHVDGCSTVERLIYLSMTERYTAVICKGLTSQEAMLETFERWKKEGCTSLFVITTTALSWVQRAKLLEAGVGMYFIKPYSYIQLVSTLLKYEHENSLHENYTHRTAYFEVDMLRRTAKSMGATLGLTKTEFDLLALFLRRKGTVLSRLQIWEDVWGYEDYPLANTVDVHINRLRKKLPAAAREMISTVYGIGYRMQSGA